MKKSFSILLTTILVSGFLANKNIKTNVGFCADYDIVNSPQLKRSFLRYFINDGSIAMPYCPDGDIGQFSVQFKDNEAICQFRDMSQPTKIDMTKRKIFAVLIDSSRGPIDYKFIERNKDIIVGECSFKLPINSECLDVHLYLQNEDDPDFLLREENFLCKSRFFSSYATLAYIKKIQNCVQYYDPILGFIPEANLDIYQSGIPNIYVINLGPGPQGGGGIIQRLWGVELENGLGLLDLPDGKNDLVKFEDRIFPVSFLGVRKTGADMDSEGDSMLTHYRRYIYVKVPTGVTEFSIKMHKQHIVPCYSDTPEYEGIPYNYLGEFKVNLNGF